MRALLLSGYDAQSHKRWRQGLEQSLVEVDVTQLALPPRYFNWRIRGSGWTFASQYKEELAKEYDLLICTSMVDLTSLRGLAPALASLPTVLYFHENQFAYPMSEHQQHSVEPQVVTLFSALCADTLVFNSHFNKQTFLSGAEALVRKLPDGTAMGDIERLANKSVVIPVPLEDTLFSRTKSPSNVADSRVQVVWNHRWEYDKNPQLLLTALQQILGDPRYSNKLCVHLLGQQFRTQPGVFEELEQYLRGSGSLGEIGYIDSKDDYLSVLQRSHLVLSTANHDFQGLSVLEAAALGCHPVAPKHQVYPEMLGSEYCYEVGGELSADATSLYQRVTACIDSIECGGVLPVPDLSHLSWSALKSRYLELLVDARKGS